MVRQALDQAWTNSKIGHRLQHEEARLDLSEYDQRRACDPTSARPGTNSEVELGSPPHMSGMIVVGTFHSHPSNSAPGPSVRDIDHARSRRVPGIIRAPNGLHVYGYEARIGDSISSPSSPAYPR